MHPSKFFNEVEFVDVDFPGKITEQVKEFMKDVHPAQLLNSKITIPFYEVKVSYMTARENYREVKKYVFAQPHDEVIMEIEMIIDDWVRDHNEKKPFRAISNVQILDIVPVANAVLHIK